MHNLLFLEDRYKLNMPDAIDSCIWARWPDPESQPFLFETIKKCMIHGPCGAANPSSPCMEDGRCTKGYPKPFCEHTSMDAQGFPTYFRPNDGRSYSISDTSVDNRWIVPFCPFLSATFNCHINVECAASLGSLKYLFKYIQKGPDLTSLKNNKWTRWNQKVHRRPLHLSIWSRSPYFPIWCSWTSSECRSPLNPFTRPAYGYV